MIFPAVAAARKRSYDVAEHAWLTLKLKAKYLDNSGKDLSVALILF